MRKELGETIRLARKVKKLSLRHVAAELGVALSYVHAIEQGRSPISWKLLPKLAMILSINTQTLAMANLYGSHEYQSYLNVIARIA